MGWSRVGNPTARKADVERAVKAMQLYLGSVDYASLRSQQRLYDRVMRRAHALASSTGISTNSVWEQLQAEAQRRGVVRPLPGRDM